MFESTVHPGFLDLNKVILDGETHDNYNSGEVYDLNYSFSDTGNVYIIPNEATETMTLNVLENEGTPIYKVTVKLKNPSRLAAWLAKIRAGRIAGEFEYMGSDAEKVKAVHDYLSHFDAYYGNTYFSRKWLSRIPNTILERSPQKSITHAFSDFIC